MFIHLLPLYIYSSIAFMLFFISKYAFLFYSFIFYSIDKKRSLFKKNVPVSFRKRERFF